MNRKSISEKADRLNKNHRVILLSDVKALVIGDHDTYDVIKLSIVLPRDNEGRTDFAPRFALRNAS